MKKWLLLLPLVVLVPLRAIADDSLVTFDGGIGVDPVSGIAGTAPALNVVRGVLPGGFPWVIDDVLTPTPAAICDNPVLLIATPGTHHWFAAAIPNTDDR